MRSFEKLLDTARKANLITEEDATAMLSEYNTAEQDMMNQAADQAAGQAFKEGYEQGFTNAKQQAEAETKKSLDELLAKCDDEATEKLQTIIDLFNKNIDDLNADHAKKLQEVYDLLMQNMVPTSELEAMDEDHAQKFEEALNAKDEYDANKLQEVYESIKQKSNKYVEAREKFHNDKLNAYKTISESKINKLNNLLTEEREKKMDVLTESVEKFLNYSLQKKIPTKALVSEAKYNASQKAIEKITSILKINSILQESKDGIFQDYENKIKEAKAETNKLMSENINLKQELNKKEAQMLLESQIAKSTPSEAAFLRTYFKNASSPKVIEEQIEDARASYRNLRDEKRKAMVNEAKSTTPSNVVSESKKDDTKKEDVSKKHLVSESKAENTESKSVMTIYSEMLKRKQ